MRLLLNYLTRRLLVSALCSATQTALVAPGHIEMLFRQQTVRAEQFVGGATLTDLVTRSDLPLRPSDPSDICHLPALDALAMSAPQFFATQM